MNKSTQGNPVFFGGRESLSEEGVFRPSSVWTVSLQERPLILRTSHLSQVKSPPLLNYKDGVGWGEVFRWIPYFPSVPLVLGGLPLHTLLTELPVLFSGCFSTKGNYTHSCRRPKTLKELRSAILSGGLLLPQELLGKATWPNLLPFSHW